MWTVSLVQQESSSKTLGLLEQQACQHAIEQRSGPACAPYRPGRLVTTQFNNVSEFLRGMKTTLLFKYWIFCLKHINLSEVEYFPLDCSRVETKSNIKWKSSSNKYLKFVLKCSSNLKIRCYFKTGIKYLNVKNNAMRMKITHLTIKLHLFYIIDHYLYNTSGTALHKSERTKTKQQKLHLSLGYKLPTP